MIFARGLIPMIGVMTAQILMLNPIVDQVSEVVQDGPRVSC